MAPSQSAPSQDEWYYPELTFETEADRDIFQQALIDKRDFYLRGLDDLPADLREVAERHLPVLESMIDELGRADDPAASYTVESPAQLNSAISAVNFVYETIDEQPGNHEEALENLAQLSAVLVEAHWKDNPLDDFVEADAEISTD